VLTPRSTRATRGTTESDPLSIMCYHLPGKIMKDGKAVTGGADINPRDFAFAASLYSKRTTPHSAPEPVAIAVAAPAFPKMPVEDTDTFHLIVMDEFQPGPRRQESRSPEFARILATYGGARVTASMRLRRASRRSMPTGFYDIIKMHERIRAYTNREKGTLPSDPEMVTFGGLLFETLLQGDVRRLYDEARSRQSRRLDFVLTSMIPWVSEKPWEFAFDRGRQSFLATEEMHFVRNVLTNVPTDAIVRPDGPLRILVASAQPVGFGRLSVEQEVKVIRRGFEALEREGLVRTDVLARTNPETIHKALMPGSYQVVHFIGHGVYNEDRREGCLVFENERGGEYTVGERALREIFCRRGLSLVFLNACESGRGGPRGLQQGRGAIAGGTWLADASRLPV
jgi:CHAT domain-containing protein